MGMSPWQNRASIIASWQQSAMANHFSDAEPRTDLALQSDALLWSSMPNCIPKASRMTHICGIVVVGDEEIDQALDVTVQKNTACNNSDWTDLEVVSFGLQNGAFALNCDCLHVFDGSFDKCDLWRVLVTTQEGNSILQPVARFTFFFELR